MSKRDIDPRELETLHEVLVRVLPVAVLSDMTALAIECAKAVRAAFDEALDATEPQPRQPSA
jgi:hypothetical protein